MVFYSNPNLQMRSLYGVCETRPEQFMTRMKRKPGARVLDLATGREGEVMDRIVLEGRTVLFLRPFGGGLEWQAAAEQVQLLPAIADAVAGGA